MKITRPQLRQIIFEERELAVEKRRLRDIINEEYLNVLQEAQNDEAFYNLIRKAPAGSVVNLFFTKTVEKKFDSRFIPNIDAFIKGRTYEAKVQKDGEVFIENEISDKAMPKEELIADVKKAGGPSGVLDFNKTIIKFPKQAAATLTSLMQGPKKAPVRKPEVAPAAEPKAKEQPEKKAAAPAEPKPAAPAQVSKVSARPGETLKIRDKAPPKGWYRIANRTDALHVTDVNWAKDGFAWQPDPNKPEEKGPPGWPGHTETHGAVMMEAPGDPSAPPPIRRPIGALEEPDEYEAAGGVLTQPKKKEKGVLHFHHPDWAGWKKMKKTYKINSKGAAVRVAKREEKPKGNENRLQKALGRMERKYYKARSKNLPYEPNFENPDNIFKNLTPEEIEIAQDAWTNLTTDRWPKPGTKAAAAERSKEKKDATEMTFAQLGQGLNKWLSKFADKIPDWDQLFGAIEVTPQQKEFLKKLHQQKTAAKLGKNQKQASQDDEWIGKSMREVVKLTKAGLKKVLKRSTRANNYDGDGWFRGGLLKLRRKHPLRRKYAKWYKDYRAKKRAARRAKRRS